MTIRRGAAIDEGEDRAYIARQELGLGLDAPISVLDAVENLAGVPVCVAAFPQDVAGVFLRRAGRAFLFVNGTQVVVRQRFTLAHEYGHYVMQHAPRIESDAGMRAKDPQEVQANNFAGAFLAPRQAIHSWVDRHAGPAADLDLVVRLGAFFGISAEAACIRLEKAGVLGTEASEALKIRVRAGEHRGLPSRLGLTPFADSLGRLKVDVDRGARDLPRVPALLVRHARSAHEQGLLDSDELRAVLRGTPVDSTKRDSEFEDE